MNCITNDFSPYLFSLLESYVDQSIFILDRNYKYVGFNQKYKEYVQSITGKEIYTGGNYFGLLGQYVDEELAIKNFNRALEGSKFIFLEETLTRNNKEIIQTRFSPVVNDEKTIGLIAIIPNITYEKETKKIWESLLRIAEEAQTSKSISDLVKYIHNRISELIFAKNFYICLYDEESDRYFIPYFIDEYDKIDTTGVGFTYNKLSGIITYDLSQTITDYVRRTGKLFNYSEEVGQKLYDSGELKLWGTFSPSWLGVPLKLMDKTIGVMAIQNYDKVGAYTKKDEDLLVFVSDHIARAIEKKRIEEEIYKQHQLVIQQKNDIMASIKYARYIQSSILPQKEQMDLYLKNYFVLFKPKEIVSGDFYWMTNIENKTIISAVDCTGHGVPGAFMSLLGAAYLDEIINKEFMTHPGAILDRLRNKVIRSLQQTGKIGEKKDGMDIALCVIDYKNMILQFSGANNSLYIVRKSKSIELDEKISMIFKGSSLLEFKGDQMPIGIYDKMDPFNMHEIKLLTGDFIYIFTDGFADQFGGPDRRKLQYKNFKKMILEYCSESMEEQKHNIERYLEEWQGGLNQIDDILVIGIKIN
ncbi:MAG: SpoIIE family protein phosphatase [Bacteroidia bacterium]|nr:SpoIIE family protein phosphatase [Bacteroidia bacterium]